MAKWYNSTVTCCNNKYKMEFTRKKGRSMFDQVSSRERLRNLKIPLVSRLIFLRLRLARLILSRRAK